VYSWLCSRLPIVRKGEVLGKRGHGVLLFIDLRRCSSCGGMLPQVGCVVNRRADSAHLQIPASDNEQQETQP